MEEKWRAVAGYEGTYEVSSHGRVRSLDRVVISKNGRTRRYEGRSISFNDSGPYTMVQLCLRGAEKLFLVHRLVAIAFLGRPEEGMVANHINGRKKDNRIDNLEWVTRSGNNLHAYELGLMDATGSKNGQAKLTESDIPEVRRMAAMGVSHEGIAEKYGVHRRTISDAVRKKTWCHVVDSAPMAEIADVTETN